MSRGVKWAAPAQPGPKRPDYINGPARLNPFIIGPHIFWPDPFIIYF